MPERLFQEWQAFYQIEPFGGEWRQAARICMVMQNMMRGPKSKSLTEDDFMPTKSKPVEQSQERVEQGIRAWLLPMVEKKTEE